MLNDPVLSIIVPVYNSEKTLTQCLDSIISQTLTNFECILVDDGSTDKSPAICNEYVQKDSRIQVLHKPNEGASAARNDGIKAACGEYIAFVDSDDYILPDMYRLLLEEIENEKKELVCCGYTHRNKVYLPPPFFYGASTAQAVYHLEHSELFGLIWNKLYLVKIIKTHNISFHAGQYFGEDMFFNLQYFGLINSFCLVDKALYVYCENSQSISKKRPSFDQCLSRFNNVSSSITKLRENQGENYINRILSLDFTYTVFLIRVLYQPKKENKINRYMTIKMVKSFYRTWPAKKSFRSNRYAVFYFFLMFLPVSIFDFFASIIFA
jgi:glycosyltransferase involved in cell wall biosynthesis